MKESGGWQKNLTPVFYPAGRLCEGKINGDAVSRKECHYGGYHLRDKGKPEVVARRASPGKHPEKPAISLQLPLVRQSRHFMGGRFEAVLAVHRRRLGLCLYFYPAW